MVFHVEKRIVPNYRMVASTINNKIKFAESFEIDDEDIGHTSDVYELDVFTKTISVILGKPKYTYADQNVVYLPIYAISRDKLLGKIGVFEISTPQLVKLYRNGSIDLAKLSPPLMFSEYENTERLDTLNADPKYYHDMAPAVKEDDLFQVLDDEFDLKHRQVLEEKENVDEDDLEFRLMAKPEDISGEKRKAITKIDSGIFTIMPTFAQPAMLREETEKDAEQLRKSYRPGSGNPWIQERMKNNGYSIEENEGSGDCFFAVIRDAYKQIGRETTVEKLRAVLANELTDEIFQEKRKLFLEFDRQKKEKEFQMSELEKQLASLKKQVKSDKYGKEETKKMIQEANQIVKQHLELKQERKDIQKVMEEYVGVMKDINTLEDMRAHVQTQSFWADTWAITTLERVLNMKLIVMSEDVYNDGDKAGVLQCGESDIKIQERGVFSPEFYIITSLGHNHYRLITYKHKGLLSFSEIPYDMKVLVVNKCMERSAGPFYLIQEFRNFKTRLGLAAELGEPVPYENAEGLFDENIVFSFYPRAAKAPKPGLGDGEKISEEAKAQFVALAKIEEWRKKLDDTWDKSIITIDGHRWSSVEHYVEGAKYKKGFPDVYLMFSLDSGSELSADVKLAKAPTKGPHKGLKDGLRIDVDYALGRDEQERELALKSKFVDNLEMKHLLANTGKALLLHKEGVGKEPIPDYALMKLRATIM